MSREKTHAGIVGTWQRLLAPLLVIPPGLERLESLQDKLATKLGRAVDITKLQAGFAADKQELSQELKVLLADGERVATAIRVNIKEYYGPRAEKLTAFGIRAFRSRNQGPVPAPGPGPIEVAAPPQDDTPSDR